MNQKLLREKDLINIPATADKPASKGLLNISKATFWKWLKLKKLPQPVKIGKVTAWKAEDIERFLEELK